MKLNSRKQIPDILKEGSIGCEIGVFEGDYSQVLLDSGKFSKLYLVDIFSGTASCGNENGKIITYNDASVLFDYNKQRFLNYPTVQVIKEDGISFLNRMINYFDFIYIDTVHTYSQTLKELKAAHHAIKSWGYISGHDYDDEQYPGLVKAVQEFCDEHSLNLEITNQDTPKSYVIQKPYCV